MDPNMTYGSPVGGASVKVAYTGTAGTTAALPVNCRVVRLLSTTDCFVKISVAGTAAVADTELYLGAFQPEYFMCESASKVSAIQVSAGGTIYATPFA